MMKNHAALLKPDEVWDAIIIGAGLAGGMTALRLASEGWRVLLVEKKSFPREKVCGGFLGPENRALLHQAGVTQKLENTAFPLRQMWLSSSQGASVRMIFPESAGSGLAVCRQDLDAAVVARACELGAYFAAPAEVEMIDPGIFKIFSPGLSREIKVFARHAVDARGGAALDNQLITGFGMTAYFENVRWMKDRVALHFADGGHFGLNPVLKNKTTGCFVATRAMIARVGKNPEKLFADFCRQNRFLAAQLKFARRVSGWQGIPVKISRKPIFFDDGFFKVGDTVATVDPIVGGGMTLALQSAEMLTEILLAYPRGAVDEKEAAETYERKWKRAFGWKLPLSHFWGYTGHRPLFTEAVLRVMKLQKNVLKHLFEWHHSVLPTGYQLKEVR